MSEKSLITKEVTPDPYTVTILTESKADPLPEFKPAHAEVVLSSISRYTPFAEGVKTIHSDLNDVLKPITVAVPRWHANLTKEYRQYIAYMVYAKYIEGSPVRYFVYKRAAPQQVGEERLASKASIGIGGHVDMSDIQGSIDNVLNIIDNSALREVQEEAEFTGMPVGLGSLHTDYTATIIDNSNDVGKSHLGILGVNEVLDESVEITMKEEGYQSLGFLTYDEIMALSDKGEIELENWSRMSLDYLNNKYYSTESWAGQYKAERLVNNSIGDKN